MIAVIIRGTVAMIAGLAVALALVIAVEAIWAVRYPFPAGVDPSDIEACKAHVATVPTEGYVIAAIGWAAAACFAAATTTWIAPQRQAAWAVGIGLLLFAAAIFNMSMLPYPTWFEVCNYFSIPAAVGLGIWLSRAKGKPLKPA